MHIEINAGGLGGGIAIAEYGTNMLNFINNTESVISSFKTVRDSTYALNGGTGNLQNAVSNISSRIQAETQKKNDAISIRNKTNDFLDLAVRVDKEVEVIVNKNKDEFYRVNPWLKPSVAQDEEKPWYEQAWDWLCGAAEAVSEAAKEAWNWISDTASKLWESAVEFYQEHKKIIDTILIVVGAIAAIAAVVATGGVALVPLLGALGVPVATAAAISTAVAVVAVVSTVGSSVLNIVDIWAEVDNPVFNRFQTTLNIVSTVSNLAYSIGTFYNSIKKINPQEIQSLNKYTGNDCYQNINDSMRGNARLTPKNAKIVDHMDNALNNASLPNDMTLYRGTSTNMLSDDLLDLAYKSPGDLRGQIITEKGFLSSSTSPSVAKDFTKNMHITINAPAGSNALDISSISKMPWEKEVLFARGQKMLIEDAKWINNVLNVIVSVK